ncbi:MAG: hypothetical protein K0Q73_6278 [Paenibacillus sp.]|jgi:hypothetical protein|nr:hypothetical protein [Paenibacillus sp.]
MGSSRLACQPLADLLYGQSFSDDPGRGPDLPGTIRAPAMNIIDAQSDA